MKKLMLVLIISLMVLSGCSEKKSGELTIEGAWARSAIQGNPTAIYFVVENQTEEDEILLSASTDVSMMTELHMSSMDASGVMSMTPQENVPIPAKSTVEFKQGGLHVMLMNIMKDLKPGDMVQLTLKFKNAGEIKLEVPVKEP